MEEKTWVTKSSGEQQDFGTGAKSLKHESGVILDPTASQFKDRPDYNKARGRGFLTKQPSKKAKQMMWLMLWQ